MISNNETPEDVQLQFVFPNPVQEGNPLTEPVFVNARHEILSTALELVNHRRQEQYGSPDRTMALYGLLLIALNDYGNKVDAAQYGAVSCILLKVARIICNPHVHDSYVDLAGYAAIAGELAKRASSEPTPR